MFHVMRLRFIMTDAPAPLRPASADEIVDALAFSLRYDGRKRVRDAEDAMARITAQRLVRHLQQSGFMLMKTAPGVASTTAITPSSRGD
jgi:hypothetical protein